MKIFFKYILSVLISLVLVCSCKQVDEVIDNEAKITLVGNSDYLFDSTGGDATLSVDSKKPWSVSSGQIWCTVSPQSGDKGITAVTIKAQANDTYVERNAKITFKSDTVMKIITVTQKQKDAIVLTSSKVELTSKGQSVDIVVNSNVEYSYEIEDSAKGWISVQTATKAMTSSKHTFAVKENDGLVKREGKIVFRSGNISETVTVYQSASTPTIVLTKDEYNVGSDGETIEIQVRSNLNYEMVMPEGVDWLEEVTTKGFSDYTHYITVKPNATYDSREAVISFISDEWETREEVKIVQLQKDALVLASSVVEVSYQEQEIELEVSSNIEYSYEIEPSAESWISEAGTRAMSSSKHLFLIGKNTGSEKREGKIVFTSGDISDTVTVRQQPDTPRITPSSKEYKLGSGNAFVRIRIDSNVDYTMVLPEDADWLAEEEGYHSEDGNVHSIEVKPNETYESREAEILFVADKGSASASVRIIQYQKNAIILSENEYVVDSQEGELVLEVATNVSLQVSTSDDWMKYEPQTKALDNVSLNFSIAANPNLESRVGTITISSEDISQTVKVTQLGNENYNLIVIRHTNSEFAVPAIEGNNIVGIVEWGDGTVEKYIPNMKHTYQQSKEYKMLIKLVGATVCEIPDMIGIEEVDFSKF